MQNGFAVIMKDLKSSFYYLPRVNLLNWKLSTALKLILTFTMISISGFANGTIKEDVMDSYDIVAEIVRLYWRRTHFAQDMVVYFKQKYEHEKDWEWCEEIAFCNSDTDMDNVSFLNDFCEGQTCVNIYEIVPLTDVIHQYHINK